MDRKHMSDRHFGLLRSGREPAGSQREDTLGSTGPQNDRRPDRESNPATPPRTSYATNRNRCGAVIVIDKSAVFRVGLEALLAELQIRVAASLATVADFSPADVPKRLKMDPAPVLLVGLDEDPKPNFEWVAKLAEAEFRTILLGTRFEPTAVLAAIEAGVRGYLLKKEVEPLILLNAIVLVRRGNIVIPSGWRSSVAAVNTLPKLNTHEMTSAPVSPLSKGELLILGLLTRGASNKEIARSLGIAEATVKVRMGFLLRKLRVSNRTQAAIWAGWNLALAAFGFAFGYAGISEKAFACF